VVTAVDWTDEDEIDESLFLFILSRFETKDYADIFMWACFVDIFPFPLCAISRQTDDTTST
jgi:hypothetical protein